MSNPGFKPGMIMCLLKHIFQVVQTTQPSGLIYICQLKLYIPMGRGLLYWVFSTIYVYNLIGKYIYMDIALVKCEFNCGVHFTIGLTIFSNFFKYICF